jgi:hypothetical protein
VFGLFLVEMVLLLSQTRVQADQKSYLFQKGNELYQKGKYAEAARAYEEILKMGYASPEVYYNLGNAYYKQHKIGLAVLNYNRALRLAPRDEDIRHNLDLVNLHVVDRIPAIPELFYTRYFRDFQNLFGMNTWVALTLIFYILLVASLIVAFLLRKAPVQRFFRRAAWFFGVIFLISAFTLGAKTWSHTHNVEGVVLVPKVDVRSAPTDSGTIIFSLHEGVKVKVEQTNNGWLEIRLADGKEGWLPGKALGII